MVATDNGYIQLHFIIQGWGVLWLHGFYPLFHYTGEEVCLFITS